MYKLFSLRGYQTKYALYQRTDGSIIDFRLGLHDANGNNFDSKNTNISVYISYTYRSYRGLSTIPYEEYEIKPQTFKKNPKMVVDSLVKGVLSAINGEPFELDPNVATSIDTTKTDTIEDIINRYKNRTYKFSDGTKTYGLNIDAVVSCTINQIKMNLKDRTNTIYSLLIESSGNKTYLLSANYKILIQPTKDQKEEWAEIIHCLFKYAYNSATNNKNKQDTNMKTENRNRNVVRLNESQLKQIIAEHVQEALNESFKSIVDNAMQRLKNGENPKYVFDNCHDFSSGYARVYLKGKYNYIDTEGNLLFPNQWFDMCYDFDYSGFAKVNLKGKENLIDTEGNLLSPNQWFDMCYNFDGRNNFHNGFANVKLNGKWNYIDTEGNLLSPNQWFDKCGFFYNGFAEVKLKGKYNYIDTEGNLLSPDQWFDMCTYFHSDGIAIVELNGKKYLIDKEGNLYDKETRQPLGINANDKRKNESKVRKNIIRLTESNLRLMIEECIRKALYN